MLFAVNGSCSVSSSKAITPRDHASAACGVESDRGVERNDRASGPGINAQLSLTAPYGLPSRTCRGRVSGRGAEAVVVSNVGAQARRTSGAM